MPTSHNILNTLVKDIRNVRNVILVSANLKESAQHITNVVPVKSYDGKKSKNNTLMSLANYLIENYVGLEDVRERIGQDFLPLCLYYNQELSDMFSKFNEAIE